jgi:hypothetical protein
MVLAIVDVLGIAVNALFRRDFGNISTHVNALCPFGR